MIIFILNSERSILQSYDSVMVNSIYQLSLKVKSQTDKILEKMR